MSREDERPIYRLAALCAVLLAGAFVVPRFTPAGEGLAGAATAALVFLACLLVVTAVAVYLLVRALRAWPLLSVTARLCGVAPSLVLASRLAWLIWFLRY